MPAVHSRVLALLPLLFIAPVAAAGAQAWTWTAPRALPGLPRAAATATAAGPAWGRTESPLRQGVAVLGLLGVATLLSQEAHTESIAQALDGGPGDGLIDLGNLYGSGWGFGGLALATGIAAGVGGGAAPRAFAADLSRSLLASWGAVWVLKLSIDARRPNGGPHSFPSGHTATAFAGATVLSRHFGARAGLAAYAMAGCTALARMEDRRHHLADVLFGAGLGWSLGHLACERESAGIAFDHVALTPTSAMLCFRF